MVYWVIAALVTGIAGIAYAQHRAGSGIYRPLTSRQPEAPRAQDIPLGLEAIDLDHVARTTRRNESLERGTTNWMRKGNSLLAGASEARVDPLADDETYAARYHAAFHKDRSKD